MKKLQKLGGAVNTLFWLIHFFVALMSLMWNVWAVLLVVFFGEDEELCLAEN